MIRIGSYPPHALSLALKHDGYRFICRRDGDRVRVFSRRGNDHTDRAPMIGALQSEHIDGGAGDLCFCTPAAWAWKPGPPMTLSNMRELGVQHLIASATTTPGGAIDGTHSRYAYALRYVSH